jgi:hypothetical protein
VSTENRIVDKYYYVAEDFITNMKVVIITKPTPVIAVGDKIRTIDGHGKLLYQIQLDSKVTCFDI